MSSVVITGDTSGQITVAAPAVAGTNTITMPAGTGTLVVNGVNSSLVSGTAVASTSGTSIDFTNIPSWVKRITVMFNGVSTTGTSAILVQLGSGSIDIASYVSGIGGVANGAATSFVTSTSGFLCTVGVTAVSTTSGLISICTLGSNIWAYTSVVSSTSSINSIGSGNKTLGGVLDRIRITTAGGTDTFDAGSINILYE